MDSATPCTEFEPEVLMAYLYGECEPGERARFDAHMATCRACAAELDSLQTARGVLEAWAPPEPAPHVRVVFDTEETRAWWRPMLTPSWGLATAATLVVVVGAAIATVEIRYDAGGFMFRMGWSESGGQPDASADQVGPVENVTAPGAAVASSGAFDAPWSADLASLEDQLRRELIQPVVATDGVAAATPRQIVQAREAAPLLDEVEELISASERRQRQELALWFTEFAQEFDMQRRADQQRVEQELGALEGVADYLVRVSQR